jgi:hypothetical protein
VWERANDAPQTMDLVLISPTCSDAAGVFRIAIGRVSLSINIVWTVKLASFLISNIIREEGPVRQDSLWNPKGRVVVRIGLLSDVNIGLPS